jgi:mannosyl-oligosaccharide alpha-1,2-mannosidase
MHRLTADPQWSEKGWKMFNSIIQHTSTKHGHSAINFVHSDAPHIMDSMESFWLAETLKYFYLLWDEPERWSLDDWVFNTEAHLFRRPRAGQ